MPDNRATGVAPSGWLVGRPRRIATTACMVFQLAEDYVRPVWPPMPGQQRAMMHLDVQVDDLEGAVADAVSLGAEPVQTQPQANVRVMVDPDGHPFCLCREID